MSRINTQADRLLRGAEGFERQRTFLVQPERFASRQSNTADALIRALGQTAGTIAQVKQVEDNRVKSEKQAATMSQLLEARNKANSDPELFGAEYTRLYQSVLNSTEESDPFRSQVLRMDADSFVEGRRQAEANLTRTRINQAMDNTFTDLSRTYTLDSEDAPDYIALAPPARFDRIYDEVFDTFSPALQNEILEDPTLKSILTRQVMGMSNTYQSDYTNMVKEDTRIQRGKDLDGISLTALVSKEFDSKSIQSFADTYKIPVEDAQNQVLDATIARLGVEIQKGNLTTSEAASEINRIEQYAETLGPAASSRALEARQVYTQHLTRSARLDVDALYTEQISDGEDLDNIISTSNDYLLTQLSQITGDTYDVENDNILTISTDLGLDDEVAASFRSIQNAVVSSVEAVRKSRTKTTGLTTKSTQEQIMAAGSLSAIRNRDRVGLELVASNYGYPSDVAQRMTDTELAFFGGGSEVHTVTAGFPGSPVGTQYLKGFLEDGQLGVATFMGGVTKFKEDAHLAQAFGDLSPSEVWAVQELRQFGLTAATDSQGNVIPLADRLEDPAFTTQLQSIYAESKARYEAIVGKGGAAGSDKVKEDWVVKAGDRLIKDMNLPRDSQLDEDFKTRVLIESSRFKAADVEGDLNDDEIGKMVSQKILSEFVPVRRGDTFYLVRDDARVLPYREHREDDVLKHLNEPGLSFLSKAYNTLSGPLSEVGGPVSDILFPQLRGIPSVDFGTREVQSFTPKLAKTIQSVVDPTSETVAKSVPEAVAPVIVADLRPTVRQPRTYYPSCT